MKILNFGSCNIDHVYSVEHIVSPGETTQAKAFEKYPGGKGLNQSIAFARAGQKIYHAGCVGEDDTMLKSLMADSGVDVSYLKTVSESTGHAVIQVEKSGNNSIFIYNGANFEVTAQQIDSVLSDFSAGDYLILQNEICNIKYLMEKAHDRGMKVFLNPSPINEVIDEIDINKVSYLILNETEAAHFVKTDDPNEFLSEMRKRYPSINIVLTLGKDGSMYMNENGIYTHPSFKVKAVDTTAAGDTFTGYFIAMLSRSLSPDEILRISNAAAALAVSHSGAATSIPYYDDVMKQIDSLMLSE